MTVPAPVEKTLVNIDLSKGIDERSRPELMGGITTLDNLVCDQTGAWVKRPGHVGGLVSDTTGTGTEPIYPKKILPLITGWGVIADGGRLLHKQDGQAKFRTRQECMDFNVVSTDFIGTSGPYAQQSFEATGTGGTVRSSASCSTHDAVVVRGIGSLTTQSSKLVVCEKSSGTEYTYDIETIIGASIDTAPTRIAFVGDRYLHVFTTLATFLGVRSFVIDVQSAMPAPGATFTVNVVMNTVGVASLLDVCASAARGFVLIYDSTTTISTVYATTNTTGAVVDSQGGAAGVIYNVMDISVPMNHLWIMENSAAAARFMTLTASSLTTVVNAAFLIGAGAMTFGVDDSDNVLIMHIIRYNYGAGAAAGRSHAMILSTMASGAFVGTARGTMLGWLPVSAPFYLSSKSKFYCHVVKSRGLGTEVVDSHAVVDLSTFTALKTNTAGLAQPRGSFRLACTLEPYIGLKQVYSEGGIVGTATINFHKVVSWDGQQVSVCVPCQVSARTLGISFSRLCADDARAYSSASFCGSTYLAHGGLNNYDGNRLTDTGFVDVPDADVAVSAVAGTLNGSYRYVFVYRYVDSNGNSSYSRTYGPATAVNVAGATGQNIITVKPCGLTNCDDGAIGATKPFVEVYRTLTAGTQYYLCASSQRALATSPTVQVQQLVADPTTGFLVVTDNLSDVNLALQAKMYRQPGTANSPVDRYVAPATKIVIQHKDRLFCVDGTGQRVYYSSFFVDGESAWFNPAFNFFVHAGQGPITGLASMDGRLFVFKRDMVFVVDGDGPGEAGPSGNEFSPPQALASRYGCIDHRSIVATPGGIFYRSSRGFELINRQLKVDWIGERVQVTADAYPVTTGACMGPDSRIHVTVTAEEFASGVYDVEGVELVYDTSADAWSVGKYTGQYTGNYPAAMQSIGVIQDNGVEKIAYAEEFIGVRIGDATTGLDLATTYVLWVVETGWIKQGPQARQRISGILLLAKKHAGANHAIRISLAYDYVDSYTQVLVWEPDVLNTLAIEELLLKPETQLVLAIRVKVEEIIPSDTGTYPVGTGLGAQLLGITAEALPMPNAPFANRGVVGQLVFSPVVSGISPATGGAGGGTAVSIYGTGFSASTLITIGGVAVTSLVYVTSNLMTAVTPAGTVGAQDVVAINSGGTGTLTGGFTYSAATFDPTTFTANLWVKPAFVPAANAWQSQPSDGASEWMGTFNNSGTAPAAGVIGAYACADFGVGDSLYNPEAHPRVVFTAGAGGIYVLLYPRNANVYTGNVYDNPGVTGDYSGRIGISTTASGLNAWAYDGAFKGPAPIAAAASNWHLACMRWDGVNMGLAVDSGAESTVACGPLVFSVPFYGMTLGINPTAGDVFDGMIAEVLYFPYTPTNADRTNFKSYCNTKYGLAL